MATKKDDIVQRVVFEEEEEKKRTKNIPYVQMYNKAQVLLYSVYREYCVVTLKSEWTTYVKIFLNNYMM